MSRVNLEVIALNSACAVERAIRVECLTLCDNGHPARCVSAWILSHAFEYLYRKTTIDIHVPTRCIDNLAFHRCARRQMPNLPPLEPLTRLRPADFESPSVLRKTATAGRKLAELKGLAASIPNQGILINTLALQEAKDSSAIENIVTTHDELFRSTSSGISKYRY